MRVRNSAFRISHFPYRAVIFKNRARPPRRIKIMNNISQLSRESAALAVIDMQEAFRAVIPDFGEVALRISKAVEGARLLEVPVILTEQYPKGLKHTAKEILARLPEELTAIEKACFSS